VTGKNSGNLWVVRSEIGVPKAAGFYRKLNEPLRAGRFGEEVWKLCAPHYAEASRGGRPGIDPVSCGGARARGMIVYDGVSKLKVKDGKDEPDRKDSRRASRR
jgi:hypothetical protein